MNLKDFLDSLKKRKNPDKTTENPENEESIEQQTETDADGNMYLNADLVTEEEKAQAVRHKRIMCVAGVVLLFICGFVASNTLFKSAPPTDPPLAGTGQKRATAYSSNDPSKNLPGNYSDIAKYRQEEEAKAQKAAAEAAMNQPAPVQQAPVTPSYSNIPTPAAPQKSEKEEKREQENQTAHRSPMGISFANSSVSGGSAAATSTSADSGNVSQAGGSYALQAGSVIQATLLTGITSDMPGDVVAQVRQNIYDSLTGTHLLIPQGSRLIGKSGGIGSRGNARIAVTFSRIILPNGQSVDLPSQYAIDGVGYPGMKDQYTEHTGKLYSTAFMTALIAAAAQSATGGTSGTDTRSAGQEAVSGAVADVLDTLEGIIDRQGQVQPTATIRPGFEFSVFINQDLMLAEYSR